MSDSRWGTSPIIYSCEKNANAPTTSAAVPVSSVGSMTGAKAAEWLTEMSWATGPALSAFTYIAASMPQIPQYVYGIGECSQLLAGGADI